ncbi:MULTISPECIES: minor capsid protein [Bacteria]|uniref:Phage protein, HK97 gp10 family n=2 Tax=Bacteria TaxID=2 RepID=A0A1I4ULB9_9BURK|nr:MULTISPECIES: minor capsid protein [Bacteria]SFE68282.1 hypothetical protein SAMN05216506_113145 [Saccharopolyspora kobensis]SFM89493.1 hypothetical protein SAMN02982985_05701 [Rugamonas rubra]
MAMRTRLDWNGPTVTARQHSGAVAGLRQAAEHILGASRQLVPLEEGTLERSGVASVDENDLTAAVSYDTVYAVRQHEELTWKHDAGRSAKYLERPMTSERDTVADLVAAEIRRSLS